MKALINSITIRICISLLVVATIFTFSNCDSGNDAPLPSKQEEVTALLTSAPWKVNTVSVNGVDQTAVYKNLGITFTSSAFTSVSGEPVWPASGTWTFTSADATAFTRNDGLVVTIQDVTSTSLNLALTWNKTTLNPGRAQSVSGSHVFSFRK